MNLNRIYKYICTIDIFIAIIFREKQIMTTIEILIIQLYINYVQNEKRRNFFVCFLPKLDIINTIIVIMRFYLLLEQEHDDYKLF